MRLFDKVTLDEVSRWRRATLNFNVAAEERRAAALGARLMVRGDVDYPELLESIYDPPLVLYIQGSLAALPPVAFVGSRFPTPYGRRLARRLAGDVARRGLAIVSGLARGIDGESHLAALDAKGVSWAVLGTGLDRIYPSEHRALARRLVAEAGAVLSEMPLGMPPQPELFPRRNRIVAGLSWASVIVEGRHRSGSLITARLATEFGRTVLAVPGSVDSPLSEAPHKLLREGATLVSTAEEIIEALPPGLDLKPADSVFSPADAGKMAFSPSSEEAKILALLGGDSLSVDELVQLSGLDTTAISSIMFGLEIKERVYAVPGQRYAQKEAR
jgi:DNA processing protein